LQRKKYRRKKQKESKKKSSSTSGSYPESVGFTSQKAITADCRLAKNKKGRIKKNSNLCGKSHTLKPTH
jgi:hypothetical protein